MSTFNYIDGVREDFAGMVSEIGTEVTIKVPVIEIDAYGDHVSTRFSAYTETVWITENSEIMQVEGVGQLNKDDIRFVAAYDTNIVVESEIIYNDKTFTVLSVDHPDLVGINATKVGYAKRKLN